MTYRKLPSYSLVLHGWDERIPAETLLPLFERFFVNASAEPTYGEVKCKNSTQFKGYSIRTIRKRIANREFHSLDTLTLYKFSEKTDRGSEVFEISYDAGTDEEFLLFINAVTPLAGRSEFAFDFFREILAHISPYYGYTIEMPLGLRPSGFAHGSSIASGYAEAGAWQEASRSNLGGFAHKQGRFRHVFAQNILSPLHLENRLDGKPFEEWVKQSGRGRLEKWKDSVWVWSVPNEERIRIANILHFNGLLTAPDPFQNQLIG